MLGSGRDFYNSKFKTQKQKSFNGSDRFGKGIYFIIEIKRHRDLEIIKFSIPFSQMVPTYCPI